MSYDYDRRQDSPRLAASRGLRPPVNYSAGDIIEVRGLSGKVRRVLVEYREEDIKDGQPGWDGFLISSAHRDDRRGATVWGYDSDVLRRVGRAPAGLQRSLEKGEPPPGARPETMPNMYDDDLEKSIQRSRKGSSSNEGS